MGRDCEGDCSSESAVFAMSVVRPHVLDNVCSSRLSRHLDCLDRLLVLVKAVVSQARRPRMGRIGMYMLCCLLLASGMIRHVMMIPWLLRSLREKGSGVTRTNLGIFLDSYYWTYFSDECVFPRIWLCIGPCMAYEEPHAMIYLDSR